MSALSRPAFLRRAGYHIAKNLIKEKAQFSMRDKTNSDIICLTGSKMPDWLSAYRLGAHLHRGGWLEYKVKHPNYK